MPKLCDENNLREIRVLLQNTEVVFSNYEVPLRKAKAGDFIYLDPPYSPEPETGGFVSYTRKSFSASDQARLATKFKELHRRGCLLMLSNSDTKLVRELYSDFRATSLPVTAGRMINCVGSERMGYRELLVLNYPIPMETLVPWVKQPN
jgi:DNA adenine methylase